MEIPLVTASPADALARLPGNAEVRGNLPELGERRFEVFDDFGGSTSGSGRLSQSDRDSSLNQKMSRLTLSRTTISR